MDRSKKETNIIWMTDGEFSEEYLNTRKYNVKKMNKLIPQEYDEVILKTGELVCLMDQLDATHFLPDYGVETPEQEKKTMAMMPISIDYIEKVVYRPKGAQ